MSRLFQLVLGAVTNRIGRRGAQIHHLSPGRVDDDLPVTHTLYGGNNYAYFDGGICIVVAAVVGVVGWLSNSPSVFPPFRSIRENHRMGWDGLAGSERTRIGYAMVLETDGRWQLREAAPGILVLLANAVLICPAWLLLTDVCLCDGIVWLIEREEETK